VLELQYFNRQGYLS